MSLDFTARFRTAAAVASVLLAGTSGLVLGQQKKDAPATATAKADEKVSGVILKVEKVNKAGTPEAKSGDAKATPALLRISINTNAVWRDWARDQAQARDQGSPKADAAKGAQSIATKGEPVDENSLVVVEVAASTKVETRFRSPTDETSRGETSPEKV